MTLKMLPGRKAQLGGHFGSWAFSNDRRLLALGSCEGPGRGRLGSDSWMRAGCACRRSAVVAPPPRLCEALSPGCDPAAPCRGEHRYGQHLRGRRRESPNSPRAPALRAPSATHSSRTDDRRADLASRASASSRPCASQWSIPKERSGCTPSSASLPGRSWTRRAPNTGRGPFSRVWRSIRTASARSSSPRPARLQRSISARSTSRTTSSPAVAARSSLRWLTPTAQAKVMEDPFARRAGSGTACSPCRGRTIPSRRERAAQSVSSRHRPACG